jgi:hypothetical protein
MTDTCFSYSLANRALIAQSDPLTIRDQTMPVRELEPVDAD